MKAKYIIGAVVIVLFMVWGASAFFKTTYQYVSIDDAMHTNRTVQVMGKIDFSKVNYNADHSRLEFAIYDATADSAVGAETMNVIYYGVVPGNFDQAKQVVLKGKTEGDHFVAEQMLVKCPSKYQGQDGSEYQDIKKHEDAVGKAGV